MKNEYGTCPRCGGTDLDRNDEDYSPLQIDKENQTVAICVDCENCATSFYEIYGYSGAELVFTKQE